jgi:hypothetical protein
MGIAGIAKGSIPLGFLKNNSRWAFSSI